MLHLEWFKKSYRCWIKSWDLLFLVPQVFCRETNIGSGGEKKYKTVIPASHRKSRESEQEKYSEVLLLHRHIRLRGTGFKKNRVFLDTGRPWSRENTTLVQKDDSSWCHTQGEEECMLAKWTHIKHSNWGGSIKHELGGWLDASFVCTFQVNKSLDFCQLSQFVTTLYSTTAVYSETLAAGNW